MQELSGFGNCRTLWENLFKFGDCRTLFELSCKFGSCQTLEENQARCGNCRTMWEHLSKFGDCQTLFEISSTFGYRQTLVEILSMNGIYENVWLNFLGLAIAKPWQWFLKHLASAKHCEGLCPGVAVATPWYRSLPRFYQTLWGNCPFESSRCGNCRTLWEM